MSSPLSLSALRGQVVLLHFWTGSSVHCRRVADELAALQETWPDELAVIGVHSPKFPHEANHAAVERAILELGITHPVLDDPELVTWSQYGVKGWPTIVVIDPKSRIVGALTGEGHVDVLDDLIAEMVEKHAKSLREVDIDLCAPVAPSGGLSMPAKVACDGGTRIAVADTGHDRVVVIDFTGRILDEVTGLNRPQGVRFDRGRLVICDTGNDRVVRYDSRTKDTEVLIDEIAAPADVVVDLDGSYVIAEAGRHRLWRLPVDSEVAGVIAGSGDANLIDARADRAELAQPMGLARLPNGIAFVDADSSSLRVLTNRARVATLVGVGLFEWGLADGRTMRARLQHPMGVAATRGGRRIYVADTYNDAIRFWENKRLQSLTATGLSAPGGLDLLPDGRLVVADTGNDRVVIVYPDREEVWPIDVGVRHRPMIEPEIDEGQALRATRGSEMHLPFSIDLEDEILDVAKGAPVRIWIRAEPASLLGDCTTRFAADLPKGKVPALAGAPGRGHLVVEVRAETLDDNRAVVTRHSIVRHPLRVVRRNVETQVGTDDEGSEQDSGTTE